MRVHLIKKQAIEAFVIKNGGRNAFSDWLSKIKVADWNKPSDINFTFKRADLLGKSSHRIVFDIGGNNFRIICKYKFGKKQVHLFVCWIGTHAEYDKLNKDGLQFTIKDSKN